jgi:multidrug efflux pump subunit AcrA (membrane-fusion protein)
MRRKALVAVLAVLGLLGACYGISTLSSRAPAAVESQDTAEQLLAPSMVTAEGEVLPVRKAALSFPIGGILQSLEVSEGDQVEAGVLLARLESTDQERAVAQAKAALTTARAALAQVEAGARPQEIATAEEEVAAATANLSAAKAAEDQAQATLQGAIANEAAAQAGLEAAEAEVGSARAAVAAAQAEMALLQAGASPQQRAMAMLEVDQARNSLWGAQSQRDALGGLHDKGYMKDADMNALEAAVGGAHVALNIAEVAEEEMASGPRPEEVAPIQAKIDGARSALSAAEVQVAAAEARVDGAGAETALAAAQLAAAESQTSAAEARVGQARAQLALLMAGSREEDVALAAAQAEEAEEALETAESVLSKGDLMSPFAGTVAELNFEVGEMVPAGTPLVTLADLMQLQVETTDLDEWGAVDVEVGQTARITVNAFEDKMLTGRVTDIAARGTLLNTGDTAYRVTIALDEQDPTLRWGMTTKVEFLEE